MRRQKCDNADGGGRDDNDCGGAATMETAEAMATSARHKEEEQRVWIFAGVIHP